MTVVGGDPPDEACDTPARFRAMLAALILGQICLHAAMAGIRMATPLQALSEGHPPWSVGLLLGCFAAAPVLLALPAGRLADRLGYHRPLRLAVAMTVAGGAIAAAAAAWPGLGIVPLVPAALLAGGGANLGLIVIQRTAGRSVEGDTTRLKQVFSWTGLAPAFSNVAGPLLAGALIDGLGFGAAFAGLAMLPLLALVGARHVPPERPSSTPPAVLAGAAGTSPTATSSSASASSAGVVAPARADHPRRRTFELLAAPGMRRLLLVNWLVSASWDVHAFVIPILGHERGYSASAIGGVLGIFAGAVTMVRLLIPALAHRLREPQVVTVAMLLTAAVFAAYPLVGSFAAMAACAAALGFALGAVQPMVMTALHRMTPAGRHGEAIALRSMTINLSSALMPFAFGLAGASVGAATLFWLMGALVLAGSAAARRLGG